jgi:hypothetical protein
MEPNEYFVYPGTYFICGGCGSSMAPAYNQSQRGRWRYKIYCGNPNCPNYLSIFELGDEAKVPVFDTGERAPDPIRALAGTTTGAIQAGTTTRTIAGGMAALGARDETNFQNVLITATAANGDPIPVIREVQEDNA